MRVVRWAGVFTVVQLAVLWVEPWWLSLLTAVVGSCVWDEVLDWWAWRRWRRGS